MMSLSHTTGYAVQALACLQYEPARPSYIRDVAACTGLPRAYLARIINRLAHRGIIVAKRGYRGGIQLARAPQDISLLEVVEAVEGRRWIGPCLFGINACGDGVVCPTRQFWVAVCQRLEKKLRRTTLAHFMAARGFRNCHQQLAAPVNGETDRAVGWGSSVAEPAKGRRPEL